MTTSLRPLKKTRSPFLWLIHAGERLLLHVRGLLGQKLSVRQKLTVLYGLMCALTLTVVGSVLWVSLQQRTQIAIDSDLNAAAATISRQSLLQIQGPAASVPTECLRSPESVQHYCSQIQSTLDLFATHIFDPGHVPGQFEEVQLIQLVKPYQAPLIYPRLFNTGVPASDLGASTFSLIMNSIGTTKAHLQTLRINNVPTRMLLTGLPLPASLRRHGYSAVLIVFQVERTFLDIQHVTQIILLVILPLGVLFSLLAGWWIAIIALRPVARISRRVHAIGVSRDLSQRLLFRGPEDEVSRLAFTFDDMMARLESLFNAQKRFVADASHELRTPLTAIRGNADLLRIAPPEEREQCISAIRVEAERLSRLVNDMLLLAEADLQEQPLHVRRVDLTGILEDVYRSALVLANDRVAVTLDAPEQVEVQADPDRLKQVFLNLADNAVKFTPDEGVVSLSLRRVADGVVIEVCDTGAGIPPDEQEAIFQRLYRVEESRSTRGSGLGLAISASIVEAHQGRISVQSVPGEGSIFAVWLPEHADVGAAHPARTG